MPETTSCDCHYISHRRAPSSVEEIAQIIGDALGLADK